jgi:hypothetical protein
MFIATKSDFPMQAFLASSWVRPVANPKVEHLKVGTYTLTYLEHS